MQKFAGTDAEDPRIDYFNKMAEDWDISGPDISNILSRLDSMVPTLNIENGLEILEPGCGTGTVTRWIASRLKPARLVAFDFAPEMIKLARLKEIDATCINADICKGLPAMPPFDLIFCFHALPHFNDKASALRNLVSAMKTGGRILVIHLAGSERLNEFHSGLEYPVCDDILPDKDQLIDAFTSLELEIESAIDEDELFYISAVKT